MAKLVEFKMLPGVAATVTCERLHVSVATVKSHVGHLLAKLQARDRAQLVIAAYNAGLAGQG